MLVVIQLISISYKYQNLLNLKKSLRKYQTSIQYNNQYKLYKYIHKQCRLNYLPYASILYSTISISCISKLAYIRHCNYSIHLNHKISSNKCLQQLKAAIQYKNYDNIITSLQYDDESLSAKEKFNYLLQILKELNRLHELPILFQFLYKKKLLDTKNAISLKKEFWKVLLHEITSYYLSCNDNTISTISTILEYFILVMNIKVIPSKETFHLLITELDKTSKINELLQVAMLLQSHHIHITKVYFQIIESLLKHVDISLDCIPKAYNLLIHINNIFLHNSNLQLKIYIMALKVFLKHEKYEYCNQLIDILDKRGMYDYHMMIFTCLTMNEISKAYYLLNKSMYVLDFTLFFQLSKKLSLQSDISFNRMIREYLSINILINNKKKKDNSIIIPILETLAIEHRHDLVIDIIPYLLEMRYELTLPYLRYYIGFKSNTSKHESHEVDNYDSSTIDDILQGINTSSIDLISFTTIVLMLIEHGIWTKLVSFFDTYMPCIHLMLWKKYYPSIASNQLRVAGNKPLLDVHSMSTSDSYLIYTFLSHLLLYAYRQDKYKKTYLELIINRLLVYFNEASINTSKILSKLRNDKNHLTNEHAKSSYRIRSIIDILYNSNLDYSFHVMHFNIAFTTAMKASNVSLIQVLKKILISQYLKWGKDHQQQYDHNDDEATNTSNSKTFEPNMKTYELLRRYYCHSSIQSNELQDFIDISMQLARSIILKQRHGDLQFFYEQHRRYASIYLLVTCLGVMLDDKFTRNLTNASTNTSNLIERCFEVHRQVTYLHRGLSLLESINHTDTDTDTDTTSNITAVTLPYVPRMVFNTSQSNSSILNSYWYQKWLAITIPLLKYSNNTKVNEIINSNTSEIKSKNYSRIIKRESKRKNDLLINKLELYTQINDILKNILLDHTFFIQHPDICTNKFIIDQLLEVIIDNHLIETSNIFLSFIQSKEMCIMLIFLTTKRIIDIYQLYIKQKQYQLVVESFYKLLQYQDKTIALHINNSEIWKYFIYCISKILELNLNANILDLKGNYISIQHLFVYILKQSSESCQKLLIDINFVMSLIEVLLLYKLMLKDYFLLLNHLLLATHEHLKRNEFIIFQQLSVNNNNYLNQVFDVNPNLKSFGYQYDDAKLITWRRLKKIFDRMEDILVDMPTFSNIDEIQDTNISFIDIKSSNSLQLMSEFTKIKDEFHEFFFPSKT